MKEKKSKAIYVIPAIIILILALVLTQRHLVVSGHVLKNGAVSAQTSGTNSGSKSIFSVGFAFIKSIPVFAKTHLTKKKPGSTKETAHSAADNNPASGQYLENSSLKLNGISMGNKLHLAIINGQTLAEGESGKVPTSDGYQNVKCVKVEKEFVLVSIGDGGQSQLYRLSAAGLN